MIDTNVFNSLSPYDVGKRLGLQPNRMGFCRCPAHGEKTASMKLYKQPGRGWYCFGCHKGGDVIRLVQTTLNCDFKGAVAWLSAEYGLDTGEEKNAAEREEMRIRLYREKQAREERERAIRMADEMRTIYDALAVRCQRVMDETEPDDPTGDWDPRYFDAQYTYNMCQDMSDRMQWAAQEIEKQGEDTDRAMKMVQEYRNRLKSGKMPATFGA